MFQKAYAQAVMLQTADEQIASMMEQRARLESEIRDIESQIHEEFTRVLDVAKQNRARLDAQMAPPPAGMRPEVELPRMKISPASAGGGNPGRPKIVVAS
jgi:hypothetical protein